MNKSTIALIIALAALPLSLTLVFVKLGDQYKKGAFVNSLVPKILPPFHHIKELTPTNSALNYSNSITLIQNKDSFAIFHDYYEDLGMNFFVSNDTLFLKEDEKIKNPNYHITIYYKDLSSINFVNSLVNMDNCKLDSFFIHTENNTRLSCFSCQIKRLKIFAENYSDITLSGSDSIEYANIHLVDQGKLNTTNVFFKRKDLDMSEYSTLTILGKSMKNWGVKKTTN